MDTNTPSTSKGIEGRVLDTAMESESGISQPPKRNHTTQMKDELERWKSLLRHKTPIGNLPSSVSSTDVILSIDQKNFLDRRADSEKFLRESGEFRNKLLFYTETLAAETEKALHNKQSTLDEVHREYANIARGMAYEPWNEPKTPTK